MDNDFEGKEERLCGKCHKPLEKGRQRHAKYHRNCWKAREPYRLSTRVSEEIYQAFQKAIPENAKSAGVLKALVIGYIEGRRINVETA